MIIDAKNAVLGRLATYVAKQLLGGEEIVIVNAEHCIITGNPRSIKEKYLKRRAIGSPHHGPFFPKTPDRMVRRAIRGMLPYKTNRGRTAFKRLRVHVSVPEGMSGMQSVAVKDIKTNFVYVGELAKSLGWRE